MKINLQEWAESLRADVPTDLGASIVVQVIDCYLYDEARRRMRVQADLDDLSNLKCACRVGSELLDHIVENYPDEMRGWRPLQQPKNDVQVFYAALQTVVQYIGFSIATIEAEMPQLKPYFDAERRQFGSASEGFGAEKVREIAVATRQCASS